MVNPERLHNAFAALDILARADSTAFEKGRNDAALSENDWKKDIAAFNEGTADPEKLMRKWGARGAYFNRPAKGRNDAGLSNDPMEAHAQCAAMRQTAMQHGDMETVRKLEAKMKELERAPRRGDSTSFQKGAFVVNAQGAVGRVIESNSDGTLVKWNDQSQPRNVPTAGLRPFTSGRNDGGPGSGPQPGGGGGAAKSSSDHKKEGDRLTKIANEYKKRGDIKMANRTMGAAQEAYKKGQSAGRNDAAAYDSNVMYRYSVNGNRVLFEAPNVDQALRMAAKHLSAGEKPDRGLLAMWNGESWVAV